MIDRVVATLKSPFGFYLAEVYRVRGECLAALGRGEDAGDQLRCAAQLAASQGAELFSLRSAVARSRCCLSQADRDSAVADIERSLAAIGASASPEIVAVRDLLGQLAQSPPLSRMSMQSAGMPTG